MAVSESAMTLLSKMGDIQRELSELKTIVTEMRGELSDLVELVEDVATAPAEDDPMMEMFKPMLMNMLQRAQQQPANGAPQQIAPAQPQPTQPHVVEHPVTVVEK